MSIDSSDNFVAHAGMAALAAARHDFPTARDWARRGLAINPASAMLYAYAWALQANGRPAEALVWSQKALALGTTSSLFHFHAGMINLALGNDPTARAHLARALEIDPSFSPLWAPVARQAVSRLGGGQA